MGGGNLYLVESSEYRESDWTDYIVKMFCGNASIESNENGPKHGKVPVLISLPEALLSKNEPRNFT